MGGPQGLTRAALLAVLPLLAGCAAPGCGEATRAELLFGLSGPRGPVTDAAFESFLDRSVTPRFPAGLTVLDGVGRWRAPDGHQVREALRVVLVVAPPGAATRAGLEAVRAEYAAQFGQQSVGLLLAPTCASF